MKLNETIAPLAVDDKVKISDIIILRQAIIAELDAASLYEQMARTAKNEKLKEVLLDVAKEEKVHVGEFQALLEAMDKEFKSALADGKKEVGKLPTLKEWMETHKESIYFSPAGSTEAEQELAGYGPSDVRIYKFGNMYKVYTLEDEFLGEYSSSDLTAVWGNAWKAE